MVKKEWTLIIQGGKFVAWLFNRKWLLPYYSKMMNGFYDTHIQGKDKTIWTYQSYIYIYPPVYITGTYKVISKRIKEICGIMTKSNKRT